MSLAADFATIGALLAVVLACLYFAITEDPRQQQRRDAARALRAAQRGIDRKPCDAVDLTAARERAARRRNEWRRSKL